jgi:hypothetical protein
MRVLLFALCIALPAGLSGCAGGKASAADPRTAPEYLSLNEYNRFADAQRENIHTLTEVRKKLARDADPQEVYSLSALISMLETHVAVARNLADLALLAGTEKFGGSAYVRRRFEETADMLEEDLGQVTMQNLALNKSAYKDVSAVFTGYMYDLEQLVNLVRSDLENLRAR